MGNCLYTLLQYFNERDDVPIYVSPYIGENRDVKMILFLLFEKI